MIISPLGVFEKKRSPGKYRVIHDLSWPPGCSVNDYISKEKFAVSYMSVDDVVERLQHYGNGALMSKLDLADAFHHIAVHPDQWRWLASSVLTKDENGKIVRKIYLSTVVPFGGRSSVALFDEFADALQFIMSRRGVTECKHYLDDFITLGPPDSDVCASNLDKMLQVCADVNFDINPNMVVEATPVLHFWESSLIRNSWNSESHRTGLQRYWQS